MNLKQTWLRWGALACLIAGPSAIAATPRFNPAHVAPISGTGAFATFDLAAINGPAAYLRSGPLTGLPLGEVGELLAWKDGEPFNPPSAADGRTYWRAHDRLPWVTALRDQTGTLLPAVVQCAEYNLRPGWNMPPDGSLSFAHKDTGGLGWAARQRDGIEGHWANSAENALMLAEGGGSLRGLKVGGDWVAEVRRRFESDPNWMIKLGPGNRDIGPHLAKLWLAFQITNDPYWLEAAQRTADCQLSLPFSEWHQNNLGEVQQPYVLWQVRGEAAAPWIHEAWQWVHANANRQACDQFLTLAAVEFFLTGDREILEWVWPALVNWRDAFYRSPGDACDWGGQCPGRTGDLVSLQWPTVKAALLLAGLDDGDLPKYAEINTVPVELRDGKRPLAMFTGQNLGAGSVRWQGSGGDVHGGTVYGDAGNPAFVANKNWRPLLDFSYPHQSGKMVDPFHFDAPQVAIAVSPQQGVALVGPVSSDKMERSTIVPGKPYEVGPTRGMLRTNGRVTITPKSLYLSAFDSSGKPVRGLWVGKDSPYTLTVEFARLIDLRGPTYARATIVLSQPGTWETLR